MPFAYYDRLSPARKRICRASDAIARVPISNAAALVPLARGIEPALATGEPRAAQAACQALVDALNARHQLELAPDLLPRLPGRESNSGSLAANP